MRIEPLLDICDHDFFVDIVEKVVDVPLVQLQGLIGRPGLLVEVLAAARLGGLVGGAMEDEQGQSDLGELAPQPVVGTR